MDWNIKAFDVTEAKGYLWFSCKEYNGLFRVDKVTMAGMCVGHFPAEDLYIKDAHLKCFHYGDLLIFIPLMAHHIHIYNMSTEDFQMISIDRQKENEWRFRDAVLIENQIWMFPNSTNQDMLQLDLDTLMLFTISFFRQKCEDYLKGNKDKYLTICSVSQGKAWMAFYDTNVVINWDFETLNLNYIETNVDHISSVFCDDEKLWLMNTMSTDIYLYHIRWGLAEKYHSEAFYGAEQDGLHRPYFQMIKFNGELCVVPAYANDFLKLSDGEFVSIFHLEDKYKQLLFFYGYYLIDNELWVLPYCLSEVYIFDANFNLKKCKPFMNMDEKSRNTINNYISSSRIKKRMKEGIVLEEYWCSLNDFISFLDS